MFDIKYTKMRFFGLFCFFIGQNAAMPADAGQIDWPARIKAMMERDNEIMLKAL